ncbi:MAG: TFIIB-type zinc ribbon-containing protein [Candidatus Kariarchaeaceae archaeon]
MNHDKSTKIKCPISRLDDTPPALCPECSSSDVSLDITRGEIVCHSCGLVINDHL